MTRHTYRHKDLDINYREYKKRLEDSHLKGGFVSTNIFRKQTGLWEEGDRYIANVMTTDGRDAIINNAYVTTTRTGRAANALACSENASGSSTTHTALAGEITAADLKRAWANNGITHVDDSNSTLLDHIWTSAGSYAAVQLVGTFDNITPPVTPTLYHEVTITSTPLSSGDRLQVQYTLNAF